MLFESLAYTDERRVKLIGHQLQEVAKSWWLTTKRALEHRGIDIIWKGQLNIEEYVAKFSSLLRFSPHVSGNEEAAADQFINGLNPDIFTLVNTGRPNTFSDAVNRAKGAEAGLIRQRGASYSVQSQRKP
ncbi:uncharacterized protein [Primulina eburnea]|uniref:uncharacterized protein n=1 Tax=Primulina eburnea TaxID=1245227 RepID=UPI003C6BEB25